MWQSLNSLITSLADRIPWLSHLDSHMKEVVGGTAVAFSLKVIGGVLGFGFNVLLARLLGAKEAGIYYLALTVTTIATVIGRIGLDNALLRFTAANVSQGNWGKVAGVYRKGILLSTTVSIGVTILIIGLAPWIAGGIFSKPVLTRPLQLMALSIVPMSLLTLHSELLKGLKKIRDAILVQSIGIPSFSLVLLFILARSLGINGAVTAHVAATILVLLLSIWLWRQATPQLRNISGHFDTRLLISTSLPLFLVASMNLVMSLTDTLMLGIWMDSQSVGIYNIAAHTAMLTSFVLVAVNSIVAPKFASLYAEGNRQSLGDLARNAAKLTSLLAFPVLLMFMVMPKQILGLFGPDFTNGNKALIILAFGQFINVATGSVGYLLMMCGYEKLMRNNIIASAILNIILNVALIPKYGIAGAAMGTAVSLATMNLVSTFLVYWKLSIFTIPIPRKFIPL